MGRLETRFITPDAVKTTLFGPEWPHAPVRVLRNRVVNEWAGREDQIPLPPPRPLLIGRTRFAGLRYPMPSFSAMLPTPDTRGDLEEMAFATGSVAEHVDDVQPAATIVRDLAREGGLVRNGAEPTGPQEEHRGVGNVRVPAEPDHRDDGADEVEHESSGGREPERRHPEARQQPDGTRGLESAEDGSHRRGTPYLAMLSRIHWTRAKSTAAAKVLARRPSR
jgi:hypothetical protein